ncbi:MerR family transcriptional regulator [bacterium]|nr:MerR family transcriptional regulator [bacterium]
MRMERRKFRIGELAKHLDVERFVIRFWEKEFKIKSYRSEGKQRFYEEKDVDKFKKIKHLLYSQGFTISGAKKALKDVNNIEFVPSTKELPAKNYEKKYQELVTKCAALKEQLIKLRDHL